MILGTTNTTTPIAAINDSAEPTMVSVRIGVADLQPEKGLNGRGGEEQRKHDDKPIDQHGVHRRRYAVRIAPQQPYPKRVAGQPGRQERIQERHGVEDLDHGRQPHGQSQRAQDRMPSDGGDRDLGDHDAQGEGQPALAALEHARQDAEQVIFVEDEPDTAGRDHQLHAEASDPST